MITAASESFNFDILGMNVEGSQMWFWQSSKLIIMNFMNWAQGQPSSSDGLKDCGAVGHDGAWYSLPCDQSHYGICEKLGKFNEVNLKGKTISKKFNDWLMGF